VSLFLINDRRFDWSAYNGWEVSFRPNNVFTKRRRHRAGAEFFTCGYANAAPFPGDKELYRNKDEDGVDFFYF
jgi:hypothetical protein